MKVSTDGCILGASNAHSSPQNVLDIGTGTGLLSLMLAQKYGSAQIDAVEIEPHAYEQALINFKNSPWAGRIKIHFSPIQHYFPGKLYDFIICNPPFYARHLSSHNPQRRQAFHQETLSFPELADSFQRLLAPGGQASVLLPIPQAREFSRIAKMAGLYCFKELLIAEQSSLRPHRCIRSFGFNKETNPLQEKLYIRTEDGAYSLAYRQLLQDYYLIF